MDKSNVGANHGFRGRGKVAPYATTHYRIPLPIKPIVEVIANKYRELVKDFDSPEDPELIASVISAIALTTHNETQSPTIDEVKKILDITCPRCSSILVIKDGLRKGKQRYECRNCQRKFISPPARSDD